MLHNHLAEMDSIDASIFLSNVVRFGKALSDHRVKQSGRSNLNHAQVKIEEDWIKEKVLGDPKLQKVFEEIVLMSLKMQEHQGSNYEHRSIISYFAAESAGTDMLVSYLQMPPGTGKTWVCLLASLYI